MLPDNDSFLPGLLVQPDAAAASVLHDCRHHPELAASANRALLLVLHGSLRVDCARLALHEVIARHEKLRCKATPDLTDWFVDPDPELDFEFFRPADKAGGQAEERLFDDVARLLAEAPDLHRNSPLRARIYQLGQSEYAILLLSHLGICDTDGLGIVAMDIAAHYRAISLGTALDSPIPRSQMADPHRSRPADLRWWSEQVHQGVRSTSLVGPGRNTVSSARQSRRIDLELSGQDRSQINSVANSESCTSRELLIGALAILLARLTGKSDIAIHCPPPATVNVSGSRALEMPIDISVDINQTAGTILQQAIRSVREADDRPVNRIADLSEDDQPETTPRGRVGVRFSFVESLHRERVDFGLDDCTSIVPSLPHCPFELDIQVIDSGHDLVIQVQYMVALFDETTVGNWVGAWRAIIRSLLRERSLPAGVIDILDPRHAAMIESFSRGGSQGDVSDPTTNTPPVNVNWQIQNAKLVTPEQEVAGDELDNISNSLAHYLLTKSIDASQCVGIIASRASHQLVVQLGCLKAGVPFVVLPPDLAPHQQAGLARSMHVALLVTTSAEAISPDWGSLPKLVLDTQYQTVAAQPDTPPQPMTRDPDATAWYSIIRDGRGQCRALPVSRKSAQHCVTDGPAALCAAPGQRVAFLPAAQADDTVSPLVLAVLLNQCVVLLPSIPQVISAAAWREWSDLNQPSLVIGDADAWNQLAQQSAATSFQPVLTGARCDSVLLRKLLALVPGDNPVGIRRLTGRAETGYCAIAGSLKHESDHDLLGQVQASYVARVIDDRGQLVPLGVPGELMIGGDYLATHYLDAHLLSTERFLPDHYRQQAGYRLFKTGLNGRWTADGQLRLNS